MIYDEATSSLDTHTEKEIMASINEAAKGRTNIVIAHTVCPPSWTATASSCSRMARW